VFCTNGTECIVVFVDVRAKRIGTKDVYIVGLGKIAAKLLEPNRRLRFALRPQESNTFAANRNPGMGSGRRGQRRALRKDASSQPARGLAGWQTVPEFPEPTALFFDSESSPSIGTSQSVRAGLFRHGIPHRLFLMIHQRSDKTHQYHEKQNHELCKLIRHFCLP
jgi:hypothetical protein